MIQQIKRHSLGISVVLFLTSAFLLSFIILRWGPWEIPGMSWIRDEAVVEGSTPLPSPKPNIGLTIDEANSALADSLGIALPKRESIAFLDGFELSYVDPPKKRSRTDSLAELMRLSQWFPQLQFICENEAAFSDDMLLSLSGNPEMTDYVYGYLTRPAELTGGITEEERPEDHPLFLQWDTRWGYMTYGSTGGVMGTSGCGPCCISMAAYYLTGDKSYTPYAVAEYSMANGHYVPNAGTAWSLLSAYPRSIGLSSRMFTASEANLIAELEKGNIIICSVRAGDFTAAGHFIVIHDYDEKGFWVNDPKCIYRSRIPWSYLQISDDIRQAWSIGR